MTKILMVCLGNICRSPVAEGVMRSVAKKHGLSIEVDSAGTANYHVGEHPDVRSIENARKNNVDISKLVGRQFKENDFEHFDKIYVMDDSNHRNIIRLAKNDTHKTKVDFLLNELYPGEDMPVPDPYYGTEKDFDKVFELVHAACEKIADKLKAEVK